jgi:hypothetical protein
MSRAYANDVAPNGAQHGGELGGWLLDVRGDRGAFGSSTAERHTPSSVSCASNVMLRAMHERVAVISSDASNNSVRPRSPSMLT